MSFTVTNLKPKGLARSDVGRVGAAELRFGSWKFEGEEDGDGGSCHPPSDNKFQSLRFDVGLAA